MQGIRSAASRFVLVVALVGSAPRALHAQSGASSPATAANPDIDAIRAARAELNRALVGRDTGLIARYWLPTAITTGYAGSTLSGRDNLVLNFSKIFADFAWGGGLRTPTSIETSPELGTAAEQGEFTWYQVTGTAARTVTGRYLVVWVKTDGEWRIRSELYGATRCDGPGCQSVAR